MKKFQVTIKYLLGTRKIIVTARNFNSAIKKAKKEFRKKNMVNISCL